MVGKLREMRAARNWTACADLETEVRSVTAALNHLQTHKKHKQTSSAGANYLLAAAIYNCSLGNSFESLGEYRKSTTMYEHALLLYSKMHAPVGQARAFETLKRCYFRLGEYEKAIVLLEKDKALFEDFVDQVPVCKYVHTRV